MGKLACSVCGGVSEKPTFKEAQESLDHGVGLTRGRPCPNDGSNLMTWNGVPVDPKNPPTNVFEEMEIQKEKTHEEAHFKTHTGETGLTARTITASGNDSIWPKKTEKKKKPRQKA